MTKEELLEYQAAKENGQNLPDEIAALLAVLAGKQEEQIELETFTVTADKYSVAVEEWVTFTVEDTKPEYTYIWEYGSNKNPQDSNSFKYMYQVAGTYTMKVTVLDENGAAIGQGVCSVEVVDMPEDTTSPSYEPSPIVEPTPTISPSPSPSLSPSPSPSPSPDEPETPTDFKIYSEITPATSSSQGVSYVRLTPELPFGYRYTSYSTNNTSGTFQPVVTMGSYSWASGTFAYDDHKTYQVYWEIYDENKNLVCTTNILTVSY